MSVSMQQPEALAGKIVSRHNARTCFACNREVNGGVFAFSLTGSDARWYPDADTAEAANRNRTRYLIPVTDQDLDVDAAITALQAQQQDLADQLEHLETLKMERRAAAEQKTATHGFATDLYPCDDCGHPKHRPADCCDRCGDQPVPLGITPEDFNRARGYPSMKTLTIKQPFASLIANGSKDVENRSWTTKYRGPILIHAGATDDPAAKDLLAGTLLTVRDLPHSQIIARVDLIDVITNSPSKWAEAGQYHWILANPIELDMPEIVRGKLGLWDHGTPWTPPTDQMRLEL